MYIIKHHVQATKKQIINEVTRNSYFFEGTKVIPIRVKSFIRPRHFSKGIFVSKTSRTLQLIMIEEKLRNERKKKEMINQKKS